MPDSIDKYTRHAHYLEQYYNGQSNKVDKYLNKIAKDLRLELTKTQTVTSQARITKLLDFTDNLVSDQLGQFTDNLNEEIPLFAESEIDFASSTLKLDGDFETVIPAPVQVMAAVNARPFSNRLLKDYLSDFSKGQSALVKQAVSSGFYEGLTTQEIVRNVVGTKSQGYKNGILNVSRTSADRMVRTSLSHTSSVAKNQFFESNKDLIPYYEWVATLDSRTSSICRSRDGDVFKVGKGPLPPAHYNCRSSTVPLLKNQVNADGTKKLIGGKRASVDGQVNADLNYNDWLKTQTEDFQNDVLGKAKADLFRDGGLTMKNFVNNKGQSLTLSQLKAKYPKAWGKTFDSKVIPITPKVITPKVVTPKVIRPKSFDTADKPTKQWFNNSFEDDIYNDVMSKVKVTSDINNKKQGAYYQFGKINMGSKDLKSAGARNTFRHEFGHHVDYTISDSLRTQQSDWTALQRADAAIVIGKEKELLQAYKKLGFTSRRRGYNAVKNMRTEAVDLVYNDMIDLNLNTYAKALAWGQKNIPEGTIARRLLDATDGVKVSQFWENDLIRSVASLKHAQDMGGSSLLAIQTVWENPTLWHYLNDNSVGMTGVLDNTFALGKGFGGGHTAAYYKGHGGTGEGKEIFANLFAAASKDSGALAGDLYNELMPNLVNLMKEVIGGG